MMGPFSRMWFLRVFLLVSSHFFFLFLFFLRWKGIPYATAPVGHLRFKAPTALASRTGVVTNVSDDALRCVQFGGPATIVGVKAGPGQE